MISITISLLRDFTEYDKEIKMIFNLKSKCFSLHNCIKK